MRQGTFTGIASLLLVVTMFSAPAAQAVAQKSPQDIVRSSSEQLLSEVTAQKENFHENPQLFYDRVYELVVPKFDWPYITRLILTRHYRDTTETQRQRFIDAFQSMLIQTYADALLEYHDAAEIEWLPTESPKPDKYAKVRSQLNRSGAPPIPVGFAMHNSDGEWKIYDITIDTVSLISTFRGQFSGEIRKKGVEGLIQTLEKSDGSDLAPDQVGRR